MHGHDRMLVARVSEYIENAADESIDVFTMAKDLQNQYKEYNRRKRIAFVSAVRSVYEMVSSTKYDQINVSGRRKRKRKSGREEDWESDSSVMSAHSSDSVIEDAVVKGANMMNSSLTNLYRKKANGEGTSRDQNSSISMAKEGFFIDRSPAVAVQEETNIGGRSTAKKRSVKAKAIRADPEKTKDVTVLEKSTVTFADIGGAETELLELCKMLVRMKNPGIYETLGAQPPRGFLLHGPPGCGKTLFAYAIAGELNMPFIKLAATELVSGVSGESEQKIRELFDQALAFAPCILFLDEIDAITPKRDTAQREMERRIVAQFASCLDELRTSGKHVIVIGATHRPDSLDPALRRAGRFDKEIALGIPNEKARAKILEVLCKQVRLEGNFDYALLARLCPGYVGADLSALVTEATASAIDRIFNAFSTKGNVGRDLTAVNPNLEKLNAVKEQLEELLRWIKDGLPFGDEALENVCVTMDDFQGALTKVSPSSKREGFATVPDVTWKDVGALVDVREELKWAILYPIQHPEAFESLRLESKPQGILLCGPPGCGKTLLAKAVSNETAMNFISVKGPELINMYVGESERAVREVFQRARNSAPCVIFFDELDALCPERSSFETGASARVVNQLLSEMDGLEGRRQVFIIGATNRPDMIDPAVLRPGRLDKIVYVGFPTVNDRLDIIKALTRDDKPKLDDDVDLNTIAADERTNWFTGADLAALVRESCMSALKERMRMEENGVQLPTTVSVASRHFDEAFSRVKPSVQTKERHRYAELEKKYATSRRKESIQNS